MLRFIHTADWQLGLKLRFLQGDRGARARLERFAAVERIADLAAERRVDAVLVAGDVLDDNAVGADTLQAARDVLERFAPIPVLLLPGNHDAATPDCALKRLACGPHVRPLLEAVPLDLGAARFYPCPLRRRHEREDPTAWLPPRRDGEPLRVVLAHGGVLEFSEQGETPNRIDLGRILEKGFDYVALGDWHGLLRLHPRAWYPGAPEATRFKERDPGRVLLVEIDAPGAEPRVEPLAVARTRWLRIDAGLEGAQEVQALEARLEGLAERSWTLVELRLEGELPLAQRARLEALLERQGRELLHLDVDDGALADSASEEALEGLAAEGFLGLAAEELRTGGTAEERAALRLLYRLLGEGT